MKSNKTFKGGNKMKKELKEDEVEIPTEVEKPTEVKIPKFNSREYSWCKNEKKVVFNPKKKLHCPYCKKLL